MHLCLPSKRPESHRIELRSRPPRGIPPVWQNELEFLNENNDCRLAEVGHAPQMSCAKGVPAFVPGPSRCGMKVGRQFAARAAAMSACLAVVPWPPAMTEPVMPCLRTASPTDTVAAERSISPRGEIKSVT